MYIVLLKFIVGLIILLFALYTLQKGMSELAGDSLQHYLQRFTKTTARSFLTGTISTAAIQSSTAITLITINCVNTGVMSFTQSLGVILGSNIGTTVTTQILTLNVLKLAVPMLIFGAILQMLFFRKTLGFIGQVISSFGALFMGIDIMQQSACALEQAGAIKYLTTFSAYPALTGILLGTVLTAITHSSSATTAIAMSFYAVGSINLDLAIGIVFGSNIGTCFTGILAVMFNTNLAAKKVAVANLLLNLIGVIICTPLIPLISNSISYLTQDPATQIAHIQTLFNVGCSLIFLPFLKPFASLVHYLCTART